MRTAFRSLAFVLLSGCLDITPAGPDDPTELALRHAPTTVSVGEKTLVLRTELWRDFMPISPPDGQPMIGWFSVETDDRSPIPDGVTIDRGWVLNGSLAWTPELETNHLHDYGPWQRVVVGRNGPKWGPGITVEVVVEITTPDGRQHLLRQPNVVIERTD